LRSSRSNGSAGQARREETPLDDPIADLALRYRGALERFFSKRAFDKHEVEDLVQEVFCRLAAHGDTQRIENPEAYLFQAAANLLRDRARRDISRASAVSDYSLQKSADFEEISPERVLLGRERLAALQLALTELPERTRAIFMLQRFESFTYREIAARLGISVSLVEKHMMDAIKHLTFRLGGGQ
jgi:RNA polymerase sigma-70 factor (ECF subfamily)